MSDRKSNAIDAVVEDFLTMGELRAVVINLLSNPSLEDVPSVYDQWRIRDFARTLEHLAHEHERELRLIAEGRPDDI